MTSDQPVSVVSTTAAATILARSGTRRTAADVVTAAVYEPGSGERPRAPR